MKKLFSPARKHHFPALPSDYPSVGSTNPDTSGGSRESTGYEYAEYMKDTYEDLKMVEDVGPWLDTVLLPVASTTDLLLELSNPGSWMVHCHIAEHLESGMKMVFTVDDAALAEPLSRDDK